MNSVFSAVTVGQQGCWTRAYKDVFTACHSDEYRIHISNIPGALGTLMQDDLADTSPASVGKQLD